MNIYIQIYMPVTKLTNNEQLKYICGNVSPDMNIKTRACECSVTTKSAFLQCDGYTKIYTQWYMSHSAYLMKQGGGNNPVFYSEIAEIDSEPQGFPTICYTVSNINNMDELFEKKYEIIKIVGQVQNKICKIHLFCNEDQIVKLLHKITDDIGMTELTYLQKAQRICKTFIGLPIGCVITSTIQLVCCPILCISGNCNIPYYTGQEILSYRTGLNMNKRLIVITKNIWKNNKICCDKLLYSHNTIDIKDIELSSEYSDVLRKRLEYIDLLTRFEPHRFIMNKTNIEETQQDILNQLFPKDENERNNELTRVKNIKYVLMLDNTTYENNLVELEDQKEQEELKEQKEQEDLEEQEEQEELEEHNILE